MLADWSLDTVLDEAVMPILRELGDSWERGDVSIAQEHFASQLLRGRMFGLARGWDRGVGPRAVLACAPGELHDLPLVVFGLALRMYGWRITWIGADTPLETSRGRRGGALACSGGRVRDHGRAAGVERRPPGRPSRDRCRSGWPAVRRRSS